MKTNLRQEILRRLHELRQYYPAHYAQLVALPFSLPPAYAMEDASCEWWTSDEARDFCEAIDESNLE